MTDLAMAFAMKAHHLHGEQRDAEASRLVEAALAIEPTLTGALFLKGIIALSQGDYRTGWPLYELRDQQLGSEGWGAKRYRAHRQWRGEPTSERLLLWAEQGYGDTIQMLRYVPLVARLAPNIILEVQPGLERLCQGLARKSWRRRRRRAVPASIGTAR